MKTFGRLLSPTLGPLLLLVLAVLFFWKLTLTGQYTWLDHPDAVNQVLPWFQFQAREWHAGRFPLWDPYHYTGQPVMGLTEPGTAFPLNWVFFALPLNDGFVSRTFLHWHFVLLHYLGALFGYWLCRDLGRSRAASLIGGAAFGFGGYLGTTNWPQMINGAIWAPLVLLFFLRVIRGRNPLGSAALAGFFHGVSFLSGHHQIPLFVTLLMGGLWIWEILGQWSRKWRLAGLLGVFLAVTFLVSAFQVLPAQEYGKLSLRWVQAREPVTWNQPVPYLVHGYYSMTPLSMLGIIIPNIYVYTDPFLGGVIVVLAVLGVIGFRGSRVTRILCGSALAGLLLALGGFSLVHGLIYALVPHIEKARNPSSAVFLFQLAAVVLAAHGLDACRDAGFRAATAYRRGLRVLGAAILLVWVLLFVLQAVRAEKNMEYQWPALSAFTWALLALVLWAWLKGHLRDTAAGALLLAICLFQLAPVSTHPYLHHEQGGYFLQRMPDSAPIAEFLRSQPGPFRVELNYKDIPFNFGDWYGVEQHNGNTRMPQDFHRIHHLERARRLTGTRYYISREPGPEGGAALFDGPGGVKVFERAGAFPRVWTVHEVVSVPHAGVGAELLANPEFDPARRAFVELDAPALETCAGEDEVERVSATPREVVIRAKMRCAGMVVLADAYFPGWVARVDWRVERIYKAYGFLRGVVVPAGEHRIVMTYRPSSVYLGAVLSVCGLLVTLALVWIGGRLPQAGNQGPHAPAVFLEGGAEPGGEKPVLGADADGGAGEVDEQGGGESRPG